MKSDFVASEVVDRSEWDSLVVSSTWAHPVQSWGWGAAKQAVGQRVLRIKVVDPEGPALLAQIFLKRLRWSPVHVGWVPKGPISCGVVDASRRAGALAKLRQACAEHGICSLITQPFVPEGCNDGLVLPFTDPEQTFWVDLRISLESLDRNLQRQARLAKNRFAREGGTVVEDNSDSAFEILLSLYSSLVTRKKFEPYGGGDLIRAVWNQFRTGNSPSLTAHIYQARLDSRVCSTALLLRINRTALVMWGGFDYEMRRCQPNHGLHWGIMQRLAEAGVERYDLGGANERKRSGVFEFKRHMGGQLMTFSRPQIAFAPAFSFLSKAYSAGLLSRDVARSGDTDIL